MIQFVINIYKNVPQIISVKQTSLKGRFQGGMDMLEGTVRYTVVASWVCTLLLLAVCFLAAHDAGCWSLHHYQHPGCLHAFITLSLVLSAAHGSVLF